MFARQDFDLFRSSDARDNPMVVSEDLMRCLLLYNLNDFPSIIAEASFLFDHYGSDLENHLKQRQLVSCEGMDLVWAYYDIEDPWARQKYFDTKACYLKSLRDNLIMVNLYKYYESLEPFKLLDNAFDIVASVRDLSDNSPISWVLDAPVTKLHKRMYQESQKVLESLPDNFGCLGYNFTKKRGQICMRDTCGLSLYKSAEFDFTQDGIMITPNNIYLLDVRRILRDIRVPLREKSSVPEVKQLMTEKKRAYSPVQLNMLDPKQAIFDMFTTTTKDKLYPLAGNKAGLIELVDLFRSF